MFDDRGLINLFLPSDWMAEIQQRAEQSHLSAEEWLYVEVAKLLGKGDPRSAIELNKRLSALEEKVAALPRLEHELQTLVTLIKRVSPEPSVSPSSASPSLSVSHSDEDEDEPDEILYDFLDR